MKVIQSSVVRALVAIVVGVMLILYRKATLEWMVIITGALFFLSDQRDSGEKPVEDGDACIAARATPVILLKPVETMASPLLIIGWCMVYYGVAEALNSLKVYQLQRQFRKDEEASIVVGEPQETSDEED